YTRSIRAACAALRQEQLRRIPDDDLPQFRQDPPHGTLTMRFKDEVIFVTGGAGFIGSAVVRHLLDDTEAFVVNIDKLTYAACLDSIPGTPSNRRYRFAQVDICNGPALRQLFDQYQPRYVMNLAAESHVD